MDYDRALAQIADIHRQVAKGEIYRGYRSVPVAASGVVGLAAAWAQPARLGTSDPLGFVLYWTVIAACAGFVGASEIVYNYVVHEDFAARRRTRLVVGQFLPGVLAGAVITASFVHLSAALVQLLPGLWAICFGIGTFSSRPYLPKAAGWVSLFYCATGTTLLWTAAPLSAWSIGATFAAGQLLAAVVLYVSLERGQ